MFWILFSLGVILFTYIVILKPQKSWINRGVKQVCTTPLVGDNFGVLLRRESMGEMVTRVYNTFPNERYVGIHQMGLPTLMIRDPDLIKQLTVKDFDHFTDHRTFFNDASDLVWQKNIFTLKGEIWRDMRSTLSPAFTGSKMRAMYCLINDCAKQLTDYYLIKNEPKIELEMKDTFSRYANDVIATCAFGITVDSLKDCENEFFIRGKEVTNFGDLKRNLKIFLGLLAPRLCKFLNVKTFNDDITNFFKNLVCESIKMREAKNLVRPDMINLLMDARKGKLKYEESGDIKDTGFATVEESHVGKIEKGHTQEISDMDIVAQALIFFFAGFDTVSTAILFAAYELAVNPDIQNKLIDEIDETRYICKGDITYESLGKMKYMDMVISEVLRKWPAAAGGLLDRVCVKPYTIEPVNPGEQPIHIKVNEVLGIPVQGLHNDPKFYENPEVFDPERFSDKNKHKIKPYTYLPFGSGPRNCIGSRFALMEIKTIIFHVLSKFKFVPTGKSVIPIKLDKGSFTLSSEGGLWLGIERR